MSGPGESAAEQFIREFKNHLLPTLIKEIPDELFQKGRQAELGKKVEQVVDARLIRDKVPIGRQLRIKLIKSVLADIAVARKDWFGSQ